MGLIATCNVKINKNSSDIGSIISRTIFSHILYVALMSRSGGLAYLFALIGGIFGFHHLYLGRTKHALLWLTTFGGFGIGILYELFYRLNQYAREVNGDDLILQRYRKKFRERKSPAFELKRFIGQYIVAIFYGFIAYYAFPDTWQDNQFLLLFIGLCTAFAIAFGTYLTGTLGPRQCSFIWPFLGAIFGLPFLLRNRDPSPSFNIAALMSSWIFEWKIDWNPDYFEKKSHLAKRCLIYTTGGILFGLILTSAIYQNFQVDINGQPVKIKDVLADFFKSQGFAQLYQQLSTIAKELYTFYRQYGFKGLWTEIWSLLDSENDRQAFEILELDLDASQKQIESQCRSLPRKWHPDRYRDPVEKQKAQATFMNIQQACDRLSNERQRRQILNTQRRENPK